jgi:hypothetical protein
MIERIVSGGQTGADRAALDAALESGMACGGWCPRGRDAEDGPLPGRYPLQETAERAHHARTERNVIDSDGTLIVNIGELGGGTALTRDYAQKHRRPCLIVQLDEVQNPVEHVLSWTGRNGIRVLNVAGPRGSKCPEIYGRALELLREVIRRQEAGDG